MRLNILAYILLATLILCGCHRNKYSGMKIDSEDVEGYEQAYTILDDGFKDFLLYVEKHGDVDSNKVKDYSKVMYILGSNGFPDVEYFMYVHGKLRPVVDVISEHPNEERYPGIGTADLSFMEAGEREYRKYLEDSTISDDKKEFYRAQMSQIETTKVDLFDKQEKNRAWISLIRSEIDNELALTDNDIMLLTRLEREISKL